MQWVQIDQCLERLIDPFIEQDGTREGRTTMDDPVPDSIDCWLPGEDLSKQRAENFRAQVRQVLPG